jgi:hypothetical protein|tara:strand:- start:512 stop:946 length:435 start_codon:yes stop_codon:yes gene_type:complete
MEQLELDFGDTVEKQSPSLSDLTKTYIKIRQARQDLARDYEEKDSELKRQIETISNTVLKTLKTIGADSVKTEFGTISRSIKTRYWTNDWEAFNKYVMENDAVDLYEKRIAQSRIKALVEDDPKALPPGVSYDTTYSITVRRSK